MTRVPHPETEHQRFRRGGRRRLLGAAAAAIALLILGVILGPDRDAVKRRFEISGEQGPLRPMPELSIDRGRDDRHREELRRSLERPEPSPAYEIEREDPQAERVVPEPAEPVEEVRDPVDPADDPDLDVVDQVEMRLPSQTNPCFRLSRMVRPRYPAEAVATERLLPIVTVVVAFFVDVDGTVGGAYVVSNDGGPAFAEVALKAVRRWRYEPVACDEAPRGFWVELPLDFFSPGPR